MTHRPVLAIAAALALVIAACTGPADGPSPAATSSTGQCDVSPEPAAEVVSTWSGEQRPTVYPQIIDPGGTIACGSNRLMFSFLDAASVPVAAPDRSVTVNLFDLGADPDTVVTTAEAEFVWAIEDEVGVYIANVDISTVGLWGAEFVTAVADAAPEIIRVPFDVRAERSVVGVGDPAPSVDTPTLDDVGGDVARLSTDDEPVEAFYTTSIADALEAKEPFVVAFATPKFCATAQCGPTLDRLKPIAAAHPGVTFINVEPYALEEVEGQLQPVITDGRLTPAAATEAWRLPSEPWVFVVDADGVVRGSFMLIFGNDELDAAVRAVE
jgi:hypothetical protein